MYFSYDFNYKHKHIAIWRVEVPDSKDKFFVFFSPFTSSSLFMYTDMAWWLPFFTEAQAQKEIQGHLQIESVRFYS